MNPVPDPRAGFPATPSKRSAGDIAVERIVLNLNSDYGLGVDLPDPTLSPLQRQQIAAHNEQFSRCNRIYRFIHYLYYQRGDFLDHALSAFFNEAKAASLCWVPKPRADPGTLPSSSAPPRAQTPGQQWNLQSILIDILDRAVAERRPALLRPRINAAAAAGPAIPPALVENSETSSPGSVIESPASTGSKRSYDGQYELSAKRSRAQDFAASPCSSPTRSHFSDALDSVPTRRRLVFPPVQKHARRRDDEAFSNTSNSTPSSSSSRAPSIFNSGFGTQSTQATAHDSREPEREFAVPPVPVRDRSFVVPEVPAAFPRNVPHRAPPAMGHPASQGQLSPQQSSVPSTGSSELFDESDLLQSDELELCITTPHKMRDGPAAAAEPTPLQRRLENIWPIFPPWLRNAPLAVAWEITRICVHCKVDLADESLQYDPAWATSDMLGIWRSLAQLDVFRGKSFPERPSAEAFAAALGTFESRGNTVVMSAALEFNPDKKDKHGPLFLLDMKPLRLDEGCRLTRRFGPDRFLEVLVPSPTAMNAPAIVKDGGAGEVIRWLTQTPHSLVGRQWQAFYTKDAGYRKPAKELKLGPDAMATSKERVHFFAEDGPNFRSAVIRSVHDIPADSAQQRTRLQVSQMLDWLLQIEKNVGQPHLKLFSRIQLGLSKTFPAVTFEPHQIHHHPQDILSPIGKVMNDGIGRMSRSVARKIRDVLGLSDIPSAIQGRMGSAKGMWLMDVKDAGDEDWIETYPSQRKWDCDERDPLHRTLEIRAVSSELKPASLNLQFLPVLEDRARDKRLMRQAIGKRLTNDLQRQFDEQKSALKRPLQFRQWVNENASSRSDRVRHGQVSFLGGLPENKAEILTFLLNSGFSPKSQKYLQDLAWDLQKQKCDVLRTKLNIRVGRSAYIYMVIDFWGVLEENEVHVGFSSKFRDESDDISYTILSDMDILVARSPAHFPSDIQKVRAVFKPELHALKDVIVFPAKGNVALADKLSGGDYDGDLAWVCWDPDLVENFVNAEVPEEPNLDAYLGKDKTTFKDLVRQTGQTGPRAIREAVHDMINKSFQFAMQPNYLGICTNYKERACYHSNSVSDDSALLLSALVGKLVDQSKQGLIFNAESWDRLRKDHFRGRKFLDDPAYKRDNWTGDGEPRHIIDHLKFDIAKPAIDRELEAFHKAMAADKRSSAQHSDDAAHWWDPDLAVYSDHFHTLAEKSRSLRAVLDSLKNSIGAVREEWSRQMQRRDGVPYPDKVKRVHAQWLAIEPPAAGHAGSNKLDPKTAALLEQPYLSERGAAATSYWALLRASVAFKTYPSAKFVWQMAGYQLAFIKAQISSGGAGADGMPLLVMPLMYAGLMPDGRFVKQYTARLEGDASECADLEDDGGADGGREDDVD